MVKWWMAGALLAAGWGTLSPVRAQYLPGTPTPPHAAEPLPCARPPAAVYPGPLNSATAPPGPADDLSLPTHLPDAFSSETPCCPMKGWYPHIGALALQRERLGNSPFIVRDPGSIAQRRTGDALDFLDTGNPPPPGPVGRHPVVQDFNNIQPDFAWGVRGTVGYLWDGEAMELSGFYIPRRESAVVASDPGRLDLFFFNPPLGFEGDNGMWLQADQVRTSLFTTMGNAELNYRWWSGIYTRFEGILGFRYFDLQERLNIFTDDDGLTIRDVFERPDPNRQAIYSVRTHNHFVGPQLGCDWHKQIFPWLTFGWSAKGMWGANLVDIDVLLQRGDGFGRLQERRRKIFSHLYETGLFLDFYILPQARLHAGYNTLWVVHLPEAVDQIDYDLSHPAGRKDDHGNIFYHGPTIELQLFF